MTEFSREDLVSLIHDNMLSNSDIDQLMKNQKDAKEYVHFRELAIFQVKHLKDRLNSIISYADKHGSMTSEKLDELLGEYRP